MTKPIEKPKRPLSGYNLFYRYKRNKVLEATSSFFPDGSADSEEEKTVINSILHALPGLEGIPPNHPVWSYPAPIRNELRASNIRTAMEGKLLPNENARSRLHRKVHGLGFVEMGKVMRSMWADVDKVTKDIFGELADVGRVTYRYRLAEYKLQMHRTSTSRVEEEAKSMEAARYAATMSLPAPPLTNHVEATPATVPKLQVALPKPFVTPGADQPTMMQSIPTEVMFCQTISPATSGEQQAAKTSPSFGGFCMPITPGSAPESLTTLREMAFGKRRSSMFDTSPVASSFKAPVTTSPKACMEIDSAKFQKTSLRDALPPPPLFQKKTSSESTPDLKDNESSSSSSDGGFEKRSSVLGNMAACHQRLDDASAPASHDEHEGDDDVSTHDMLRLITKLDDSLLGDIHSDGRTYHLEGLEKEGDPSLIFGQPVHDV